MASFQYHQDRLAPSAGRCIQVDAGCDADQKSHRRNLAASPRTQGRLRNTCAAIHVDAAAGDIVCSARPYEIQPLKHSLPAAALVVLKHWEAAAHEVRQGLVPQPLACAQSACRDHWRMDSASDRRRATTHWAQTGLPRAAAGPPRASGPHQAWARPRGTSAANSSRNTPPFLSPSRQGWFLGPQHHLRGPPLPAADESVPGGSVPRIHVPGGARSGRTDHQPAEVWAGGCVQNAEHVLLKEGWHGVVVEKLWCQLAEGRIEDIEWILIGVHT
eukprot:scaffold4493_cov390-Prasinococcus_capsulatus_cf.AAC.12